MTVTKGGERFNCCGRYEKQNRHGQAENRSQKPDARHSEREGSKQGGWKNIVGGRPGGGRLAYSKLMFSTSRSFAKGVCALTSILKQAYCYCGECGEKIIILLSSVFFVSVKIMMTLTK